MAYQTYQNATVPSNLAYQTYQNATVPTGLAYQTYQNATGPTSAAYNIAQSSSQYGSGSGAGGQTFVSGAHGTGSNY